jgi:hypothetical protein
LTVVTDAHILGWILGQRYVNEGYNGLFDRRRGKPSHRRVPVATVEKVFALYREKYFDLNVQPLLPARWQSSLATSGVSFVSAGRVISCKVIETSLLESRLRKGDCRREMLRPVFSVSSNIASPVLLAKSARTMVSLSGAGFDANDSFDTNDSKARPQ